MAKKTSSLIFHHAAENLPRQRGKRTGASVEVVSSDEEFTTHEGGLRRRNAGFALRPHQISASFLSYEEARALVIQNKVVKKNEYRALQKVGQALPKNPEIFYGNDFKSWHHFTGRPEFYETLEECQRAARALKITGISSYQARVSEDRRLPFDPSKVYPDFPGFEVFLGIGGVPYDTYEEASAAAKNIGITTRHAYGRKRKLDQKLPKSPISHYSSKWKGWSDFLQLPSVSIHDLVENEHVYQEWDEFQLAIQRLQIKSHSEYIERRVEDIKLPEFPDKVYIECWPGWTQALVGRKRFVCKTWQEAKAVAISYRFTGYADYRVRYSVDNRLPADPTKKYSDFPGWTDFLILENFENLEDVKFTAKMLRLKGEDDYKKARSQYPNLPDHPEITFSEEWVNWYDTCGLITPYSYEELQLLAKRNGCKTLNDYRRLGKRLNDPKVISRPEHHYKEWTSVYDFLGTDRPYLLSEISDKSAGWKADVSIYLEQLPVMGSREHSICKFIRQYVEPNGYGENVLDFLLKKRVDTQKYMEFISAQGKPANCRRIWFEVNDYLNDALKRNFFEEDEDGKIYRVADAANPLAGLEYDGAVYAPSESVKPVLAYQFVKGVKDWIVPPGAVSFSDLKNLHEFDADYFLVDESVIDFDDPNCVYRKSGNQYFIWVPNFWMALYALVSVPARGRQIMYNDSGEADEYLVKFENGKPVWVANDSPFAECGKQQAFVSHDLDGKWGMHFTSNKTSYDGAGYDVPWIPEPLIYWLTTLREWQKKYNLITKPTKWVDCAKRCNFSKQKLKKKGENCFLFRGFGEDQPPIYAGALASRLAAALYYTQPSDLVLAIFDGEDDERARKAALTRYKSEFTTHSMRVSLITAYVMDFGMPIEIIMKVVGHASIVMSIYYVKIGTAHMRHAMAEGEKRALLHQARDAQIMIEQNRLDELAHQMVGNSKDALDALLSGRTGTQLVRDYGICPYAGSRCDDGGEMVGRVWMPVQAGQLGMQNCPRCRHFVTGPVFLGGLSALWNEISLNVKLHWQNYGDMDSKLEDYRSRLQELRNLEFDMSLAGKAFDDTECLHINVAIRKLESEQEGVAKKMDLLLSDMQALTKLINECKVVLNEQGTSKELSEEGPDGLQLIVSEQSELQIVYEETSLFQQLNEVCVNATLYESASAVMATPRRSQMIDRMALMNGIRPAMLDLGEREQLNLGNQVTEFFFKRLQSWQRIDQLVSGELLLEDLRDEERITREELTEMLTSQPLTRISWETKYASKRQRPIDIEEIA